jgi:hypothetical protein
LAYRNRNCGLAKLSHIFCFYIFNGKSLVDGAAVVIVLTVKRGMDSSVFRPFPAQTSAKFRTDGCEIANAPTDAPADKRKARSRSTSSSPHDSKT